MEAGQGLSSLACKDTREPPVGVVADQISRVGAASRISTFSAWSSR